MNDRSLQQAAELLTGQPHVLAFVGSGLSVESGVPTFRGPDGMFSDPDIARMTHVDTFEEDPQGVLDWYQARREQILEVRPNEGHFALARLSARGHYTVATQNVDNLLERACRKEGFCPDIWHLHGSLALVKCHRCEHTFEDAALDLSTRPICERCGGPLRPGVVWFGEHLPEEAFERSVEAAANADVCLLIGTSGLVYPAASLPVLARQGGATLIEINPRPTDLTPVCDVLLRGPAGTTLPALEERVEQLVKR